MSIGKKLQQAIDKNRTNVNEVARRANVAPTVLYSIIRRNSKSVDINVLITIADILGVPVEFFGDNYDESVVNDASLMKEEKLLLKDFRKLNPVGQEKATEYVHDLTDNIKYTTQPETEEASPETTAASSA